MAGSQRHVQDKSYFVGILRAKMAELTTEIKHIQSEVLAATDEQSTFLAYEKRVKEAAGELTEQQAKLADYNLLVDKLNTDTEVG
jgi:intraflagellar transport protein 74